MKLSGAYTKRADQVIRTGKEPVVPHDTGR